MTADALLNYLTQALFFAVFVLVLVRTARRPSSANVDAALFFGDLGVIVAYQWVSEAVGGTPPWWAGAALAVLLMALPYLLLRLVDDFTVVPGWLVRAAEAGLILSVLALVTSQARLPIWQ